MTQVVVGPFGKKSVAGKMNLMAEFATYSYKEKEKERKLEEEKELALQKQQAEEEKALAEAASPTLQPE